MILVLVAPPARAGGAADDSLVVAAKRLSVRRLEPGLPDVPLERWLAHLVRTKSPIAWELNDCGEGTGSPADSARDLPACGQATAAARNGGIFRVSIALGTVRRGIAGEPALFEAMLFRGPRSETFHSLSALERAVRRR